MHRDGDRLVIEPVRKRGLIALLNSRTPLDDEFPQVDDPLPASGGPAVHFCSPDEAKRNPG